MEEGLLISILKDNQIEPNEFKEHPERFKTIECFHFNLPTQPNFSHFSQITELRIIEQDVNNLDWISETPNLTTILVFHTQVSDTSGLNKAPYLKKIIIERSKVSKFPDITSLKYIEHLSIANNPIQSIDSFPTCETLKFLDISSIGMPILDPSITNLSNLETLFLGGNNLHDFQVFEPLSKLNKLRHLNLYDPNYGINPVCKLPNYNILSVAKLPQVCILDTYNVSERYRAKCFGQMNDTELFYISKASTDMSEATNQYNEFHKNADNYIARLTAHSALDLKSLASIYTLLAEAETVSIAVSEFSRLIARVSFETAGAITVDQMELGFELPKTIISNDFAIEHAWEIQHLPQMSFGLQTEEDKYVKVGKLEEVPTLLMNWTKDTLHTKETSITIEDRITVIIHCKGNCPVHLWMFTPSTEDSLNEISRICEDMVSRELTLEPISTETELVAIESQCSLVETLTSITLINCGVESLSIFEECQGIVKLILPFNKITTLTDLPLLQRLEVIDVSFNEITEVQSLVPQSAAARSNLKELYIYGNPVCSPKTLRFIKSVFSNTESILKPNRQQFFLSNQEFIPAIIKNSPLESITFLDLRRMCITSLEALSQLPALETLYASDNDLYSIDFKSETLLFADFSMNSISEYPQQFPNLTTLMMNGNQLNNFGTELPNLQALFVGDNSIDSLPSEAKFPQLKVLFVSGNPITEMYPELRIVFAIPTLKMLNGNIITQSNHAKAEKQYHGVLFPEDLPSILAANPVTLDLSEKDMRVVDCLASEALQNISLNNNNIAQIEWLPNNLPRLLRLSVAQNQLQSLDFLYSITHIRSLDLSSNKLTEMHYTTICSYQFPHLSELNLSGNSFKAIDVLKPNHFPSLEVLNLSHNYIQVVPPNSFACGKLRVLDFSYNSLRKLDNVGVVSILSLDISHNRIPSVDEVEKLTVCQHLQKFCFNDNPLTQRISPRIRCLTLLRSVTEMDERPVTESDLSQVRMILEQNGMAFQGPLVTQQKPTKTSGVNIVQPGLPQLQAAPIATKRKPGRFPPR